MSAIAKIYAELVKNGFKKIEEVPSSGKRSDSVAVFIGLILICIVMYAACYEAGKYDDEQERRRRNGR